MFSDIFVRVAFYHPPGPPSCFKPYSHHPCGHAHHFTDCALDVFMNSLLTDWTMWNYVVPYFLDLPSSQETTYKLLLHSQRGHGLSTLPTSGNTGERLAHSPSGETMFPRLLEALFIPTPRPFCGGCFARGRRRFGICKQYQSLTKSVVACDTRAARPAGNKEAWEERIRLVYGPSPVSSALHPGRRGQRVREDYWNGEAGRGHRPTMVSWFCSRRATGVDSRDDYAHRCRRLRARR